MAFAEVHQGLLNPSGFAGITAASCVFELIKQHTSHLLDALRSVQPLASHLGGDDLGNPFVFGNQLDLFFTQPTKINALIQ